MKGKQGFKGDKGKPRKQGLKVNKADIGEMGEKVIKGEKKSRKIR